MPHLPLHETLSGLQYPRVRSLKIPQHAFISPTTAFPDYKPSLMLGRRNEKGVILPSVRSGAGRMSSPPPPLLPSAPCLRSFHMHLLSNRQTAGQRRHAGKVLLRALWGRIPNSHLRLWQGTFPEDSVWRSNPLIRWEAVSHNPQAALQTSPWITHCPISALEAPTTGNSSLDGREEMWGKCGRLGLRMESLSSSPHCCPARVSALILRTKPRGEPGPSCYFLITKCFYKAFQLHTTVVLLEILQGKLPHVEGKEVGWAEKNHFPLAWAQDPPRKERGCLEPSKFFHLFITCIDWVPTTCQALL